MNKQDLSKAVREAGMVERVHTVPHHGTYTNAGHQHNCLSLLFVLYRGTPSLKLIKAMHWHDTAERWTGDIPGPVKYLMPELAKMIEDVENKCFEYLGISIGLTENECNWLRAIDKIELWLWAADQIAMGNQNAVEIERTLYGLFMSGSIPLPAECLTFVQDFRWSRLSDTPPKCD